MSPVLIREPAQSLFVQDSFLQSKEQQEAERQLTRETCQSKRHVRSKQRQVRSARGGASRCGAARASARRSPHLGTQPAAPASSDFWASQFSSYLKPFTESEGGLDATE
ncbi:hypothetical protein chiPu_0007405 [Chiloscyllium punctatum]|uniref:Uncharacterized protein n=1 Tax=Chiloscyllium punctatum TaxID=137246 RepID=A0A401SF48_CHIPU|nr:hypothetical protein [Chiloscyllium punctatum]